MSDTEFVDSNKLKTLIEISARINSSYSDLDALMVYILESAMRLVECESSSLLVMNKDDDSLRFVIALGPKGAEAIDIPVEKNSIAGWVAQTKKPIVINNVGKDSRFSFSVQNKTGYVSQTMIALPMCIQDECIGVIELINKTGNRFFDKTDLELMRILSEQAGIAYQNADIYRNAKNQISVLRENLSLGGEYHSFISNSPVMSDLVRMVTEAAKTNASVLITGESGVGKELFAEQLHLKSQRCDKPFIRVNCAALSASLLESELFGHVKGAYTNALSDMKGRFEMADGGTLFLDEIGEIPLELQAKLLRAIQDKKFERVGSSETVSVDVRIVAATNRNLEQQVQEGKFRNDLFYRLNVVPLRIPPLRRRKADIEPLAVYFLERFSGETKKNFRGFSPDALKLLMTYSWPGNVRELENSIERACVLGMPPYITPDDLQIAVKKSDGMMMLSERKSYDADEDDRTLKTALNRFKKNYVVQVLKAVDWNQTQAAKVLDIQRTYLSRLISEMNIREENRS